MVIFEDLAGHFNKEFLIEQHFQIDLNYMMLKLLLFFTKQLFQSAAYLKPDDHMD